MESALEGRWYRCRGYADGILSFEAIEFTKDQNWFALEDEGAGLLVRADDPSRRGSYSADAPFFLTLYFSDTTPNQTLTLLFAQDRRALIAVRSDGSVVNSAYVGQ